ncbi:MAG TPA: hypothetical protein VGD78_16525 [Chthoniobacterales bacterium]
MDTEEFVLIALTRSDKGRLKQRAFLEGEDWMVQWNFLSRLVYTAMRMERGEPVAQNSARFVRFLENGCAAHHLSYRESAVLSFHHWLGLDLSLHEVRTRISEFPITLVSDNGRQYEF